MAYSMCSITNVTDLFSCANTQSGQAFGIMLVISLYFLLFMILRKWGTQQAAMTTSIIMAVLIMLLYAAGMVPIFVIWPVAFIAVLSIFLEKWGGD